jgi:hypothetical protein
MGLNGVFNLSPLLVLKILKKRELSSGNFALFEFIFYMFRDTLKLGRQVVTAQSYKITKKREEMSRKAA